MKVLVTGANGQLGRELAVLLPEKGHETIVLARAELDVADARATGQTLEKHRPDLVINAAAYNNVDGAEEEPGLAFAVNALGPRNLAQHAERLGCELVHVSTNYVFGGAAGRPYEPFDAPGPLGAYGRSKLAGEEYVKHLSSRWYIARTAGVYGDGHNFVRTMLRLSEERDSLKVKDDEYISPTNARDLAHCILRLIEAREYGLYHLTNAGYCSWYEFACEIFELAGRRVEVVPVPSSEYPLPAARPANGRLSDLGSPRLRHWREALSEYLRREGALR